jgi:hypothetical protein
MTTTTETPLLAFHAKAAIKRKYLGRVAKHRKADQIIQGYGYWKDGKGCAIGCTLHGSDHAAYETELGIPIILAKLEDLLFENLPIEEARKWPERFLKAIAPGADLSLVWAKFALWLLIDSKDGVINFARSDRSRAAIQQVGALYQRWAAGDKPAITEWQSARNLAASASAYAASASAYAASVAAASASASAASASAYAASASAYAASVAAASAASSRSKHYQKMADKLIEILEEAPIN